MSHWMLFIPMYNCRPQITRTLAQVTPELQARFAEIFVVDNGSTDGGAEAALAYSREHLSAIPVTVARNDSNYGLGGSHKVAFQRCLDEGHAGMIVFHGDNQGSLADLLPALDGAPEAECILGSRFMRGSRLQGYPLHRTTANILFNGVFSAFARRALWDLGSGLNAYRRAFIKRRLWAGCADDLTFNYHLILRTALQPDCPVVFAPISWREEDQVSNAKLWSHGVTMLRILRDFARDRQAFARADYSTAPRPRTYTVLT